MIRSALHAIVAMRREQQRRAHERRHTRVLDQIIVAANQNADANAPRRIEDSEPIAAADPPMLERVQLTVTMPRPAGQANGVTVEQPPVGCALEKADAGRDARTFDCVGNRTDRRSVERFGKRVELGAMKLREASIANDTALGKYREDDIFPGGKCQTGRNTRDVMRRVAGTRNERDGGNAQR